MAVSHRSWFVLFRGSRAKHNSSYQVFGGMFGFKGSWCGGACALTEYLRGNVTRLRGVCHYQVYVNVVRASLARQSKRDQAASSTDDATIQVSANLTAVLSKPWISWARGQL